MANKVDKNKTADPKKKPVANKKVAVKKKQVLENISASVPKDHVVVTVAKVVVDQDHRPSVLIEMKDGTEAWLPKDKIKKQDGKKFTIPKFLKEIKGI